MLFFMQEYEKYVYVWNFFFMEKFRNLLQLHVLNELHTWTK